MFLRLLMKHPEMLAWERLWMDSRSEQRKRIYKQVKRIRAEVQVGWHVDHGMTWDLFMRASWDYRDMVDHSDWLSVALYFDSMGRRSLGHYERNYQTILFGDASEGLSYAMYLSMLGYNPAVEPGPAVQRKHDTAFSADYVYQECKRVVEAVAGKTKVYARPGFDMPDYDCDVQPKQVYEAATAVLRAGADGVWCGREWRELQSKNKQAFGDALRDWMRKRGAARLRAAIPGIAIGADPRNEIQRGLANKDDIEILRNVTPWFVLGRKAQYEFGKKVAMIDTEDHG